MIERLAGRFVPIRVLGQGGMGEVVLVHDLATRSECALKRLRPDTVADRGALAREFAVLARVRHPAIVGVLDLGYTPDGSAWFTMQYVPGRASDLALGRGADDAFAFVAAEIALGLEALHAAGIVHGDLKPSNVLVIPGGAEAKPAGVRILDFGLATLIAHPAMGHVGTAGYAAPEVVQGARPTVGSDLYGLGATLYHLIAGRAPFEGADAAERLRQQAKGPLATWPLEAAGAPAGLVSLILRLLADTPESRPRDARDVRLELESVLPGARRPLGERIETAVLVGRERELSRIDRWVESGAARMLIVAGEPGVGRTSLVDAVATRSAIAKRPVVRADVVAGESDASFARSLRHRITSAVGAEPDAADEEADDARDVEPHAEAVLAACRGVERAGKSLLVVVDGSEHLGARGRALLRRLALDPQVRARVVQTRPTAWRFDDEGPLEAAGAIEVLELAPLDRAGAEQLVSARLGRQAPAPLLDQLSAAAGGHPGLTVELLQAAAASHAIADGEDGLRVDAARLAAVEAPRDFVAARLGRLAAAAPEVRDAALAIAVLGASAGSTPAHERGIAGLVAIGLASRDADGRATLSPPAIAPALIETADGEHVRALHRAALARDDLEVGERMRHCAAIGDADGALAAAEAAWASEPGLVPAALAARLAEAHAPDRAAEWHDRAAEQAWSAGHYGEAARHGERALAAELDVASAPRWERLAAACFRAGQLDAVARAVEAGLAADPSPEVRGRLLVTDAARRHAAGDYPGAFATATQALRLTQDADHESEGHAALTAGSVLLALDRPDEAAAMADRAASCYARIGQGLGESRAAQLRGLVLRRQGRWAEARHVYDIAMERARANASRLGVEECLFKLGQLHGDLGHGADCRAAYLEALRIALEDGRGRGVALATLNLAQFEGLSGRPREAVRLGRRAVRLARAYLPAQESFALRSLAQGLRAWGRLRPAQRVAERALAIALRQETAEDLAWCRVELVRTLLEKGQPAAALAVASEGTSSGSRAWSPGHAVLQLLAGRAALFQGDRVEAAAALRCVTAWIEGRQAPYVAAVAAQLRAELALVEGRIPEAIERLAAALASFEAISAPHDRAMALLDAAGFVAGPRMDARAPVADWLRQSISLFARLGDRRRRMRATQLEAEWLRRRIEQAPWDVDRGLLEKVGRLLHSLPNRSELTRQAMQLAVEQFDAERGVLLMEDDATGQFEPVAQCGAEDATAQREALGFSRKLVARVTAEGSGVLVYDAPIDPQAVSESVETLRLRALLCVPMFLHGRVVGAVYLDSRRPGAFGDADRRLLEGFAQLMAAALESNRATERLAHENLTLRQEMTSRVRAGLVGSSRALQKIVPAIERAARSQATVLLTGETGVGKDLVASVIHQSGARASGPFISVNCGAFPAGLLESELFGILDHVATGVRRREGRFQKAHGGTLFLDEIGEMPLQHQVALLKAIEDREVTPVGGGDPIPVDVRIIAATNRDLETQVEQGAFRKDLYFRLDVLRIEMPPLRERKGDIPELARHFASQFAARDARAVPELAPDFLADIMRRDWPGNVRELENYVERIMLMTEGDVLHAEPRDSSRRVQWSPTTAGAKLADQIQALERRMLMDALRRSGGNQSRAARELGLTEPTLRNKIAKHGLWPRRKLRIS